MGLTFNNPNDLQKMLDKFANVPDPKKTPKIPKGLEDGPKKPNRHGNSVDTVIDKEKEPEIKSKKKKKK